MGNLVTVQVLRKNAYDYTCLHQESVNCANIASQGLYWRIPTVRAGVHTGYAIRASDTKPSPDAMRVLRVKDGLNNITYWIAVDDAASPQVLDDACNACCDTVEPLPTFAILAAIIEEAGCPDEDGNYQYFANVPTPPGAGEVYKLSGSVNGTALPAAPAEGFASLADLATWADANWATGDLDGVTIDGGKVILNAGPSGTTGSIDVQVEKQFESNTPGALAGGQHYHMEATINGNVLAGINAANDAPLSALATVANNTPAYAAYGVWSAVAGKIRLVTASKQVSSATLVVTKL